MKGVTGRSLRLALVPFFSLGAIPYQKLGS